MARCARHSPHDIHPRGRSAAPATMVSALGLGGYHLGKMAQQREAIGLVHAAIDAGITFMDNAWEYHDGPSETAHGTRARRTAATASS